MRESAELARRHGVRLHTHLAETREEEAFCLERYGVRPVGYLEDLGWHGWLEAKYETVEERVCVKDASTELREIPAEYKDRELTVQVESAHTDWIVTKDDKCTPPKVEQASVKENGTRASRDVYCLVNHPPRNETLHVQCQAKPPCVKQDLIPAQYETVRRQKLVSAATTRRICIPAEYQTVEKTIKVCDGRMTWQKIQCEDINSESVRINSDSKATYARR
jgi:hypothetical protein